MPLNVLENIFDFWVDTFKKKSSWDTCIGLLKIKQRYPLSNLIMSEGLKGNAKECAPKIEFLHSYRPETCNIKKLNKPMWK